RFSRDWSSDVCSSDLPTCQRLMLGRTQHLDLRGIEDNSSDCLIALPAFWEFHRRRTDYTALRCKAITRLPSLVLEGLLSQHEDRSEERRAGQVDERT